PLWLQAAVTMQEAVVGFLIGAALGVVFGILLGRIEVLAEVLSPFIKGANAIPRVVLGSLFAVMFGLSLWGKAATAVVLVFFVVNGVFAGMFVLAVLALIAEGLISALENRLIKWRPSRVSGEIPI